MPEFLGNKRARVVLGCVLAAILLIGGAILWVRRESHPAWNDLSVDGVHIYAGQSWSEAEAALESIGLESAISFMEFDAMKDGKLVGLSTHSNINSTGDRVAYIHYDTERSYIDCDVELAGVPFDQVTHEDIVRIAGPETSSSQGVGVVAYTWIDRDKKLRLRVDDEGKVLDVILEYDSEGFEDK